MGLGYSSLRNLEQIFLRIMILLKNMNKEIYIQELIQTGLINPDKIVNTIKGKFYFDLP
jgi:hypothetical protein